MAETTLSIAMWAMLFHLADGKRDLRPNLGTWKALEKRGLVQHGALTSRGVALVNRVVVEVTVPDGAQP